MVALCIFQYNQLSAEMHVKRFLIMSQIQSLDSLSCWAITSMKGCHLPGFKEPQVLHLLPGLVVAKLAILGTFLWISVSGDISLEMFCSLPSSNLERR